MSNKNIDGIKKLSKDDVVEARKILLDYIGEDSTPDKEKEENNNKNIDGILSKVNFKSKKKIEKKKDEIQINFLQEVDDIEEDIGLIEKKSDKIDPRINEVFSKMAENKKKKKTSILEKKEKESSEKSEAKNKTKSIISKKTEERKDNKKHLEKIEKEKAEKENQKKIEEKLRKKKEKKEEKKEKRKKRKKKIKLLKHLLYKRLLNFFSEARARKKNIFLKIIWLIILAVFIYFLFFFFIIKVQPDNRATRFLSRILPVPVVYSSLGVVEYHDFLDKKKAYYSGFENIENLDLKSLFALDFVYSSLIRKYNLNINNESFEKELEENILLDLNINSVGIKRIEKIKELIEQGENFVQISNRFGDKVNRVDFQNEKEAVEAFGSKLSGLRIDELSDIVIHRDGYYIFKRYKKDDLFSFSYVFISSVSLEDYLNEEAKKLKVWILVQ